MTIIDPELRAMARRLVWFEEPEISLANEVRFLAYAFRYADAADAAIIRRRWSDDALRHALAHAPPGTIDARSWSYWRVMLDMEPAPLAARKVD
jgi:hypothetical protein